MMDNLEGPANTRQIAAREKVSAFLVYAARREAKIRNFVRGLRGFSLIYEGFFSIKIRVIRENPWTLGFFLAYLLDSSLFF
jgi:hypothetical protein